MAEVFSDIPMWTLIFWVGCVVAISLYYYRKKSWVANISSWKRFTLVGLRALGLFLIGLLLLGMLIKGTEKKVDLPMLITVVDDSQSMLNYGDSTSVKKLTQNFLNAINDETNSKFNNLSFTLDNELHYSDSVFFTNSKTDLGSVLDRVYNNYYGRNIGALILLSDGNFNTGTTPALVAEKFKRVPIYTLSVGDTIQKVDHMVKSVIHNDIAFLNNRFPVEVSFEGNKTANSSFEVQLIKDEKVLRSKTLTHQDSDYSLVRTNFELEANTLGIHEYTVKMQTLENEYNLENNEKSFFIEVLDDRSKVLLIAETLNPDVGAIRSAMISENNLEVETVTLQDLPPNLDGYDLLVWFDPGVKSTASQFESINSTKRPKWLFISPQTPADIITKLKLQADLNVTGQIDNIGAGFNQEFNLFKLSPESRKAIDAFPPVTAHYGSVKFNNTSAILAYQKVGNIAKPDPLFYFYESNNQKTAVTYATGLWSWKIANYQLNQTFSSFNEIIRKTAQYLIIRENTSRLRIGLPTIANSDEEFIINANFYNESYEPITDPTIHFLLRNDKEENFDYAFLPLENEYRLNLGRLPAGRYTWEATTTHNGETFNVKGNFAIKDLALEKQATKANHQLLMQIAENNHGKFAMLKNYQSILADINKRQDIVPLAYETHAYNKLIDYLWILLLIVATFTTEWMIRRYAGVY